MNFTRLASGPLLRLTGAVRVTADLANRLGSWLLKLSGLPDATGVSVGEIEHLIQRGADEGVAQPVEQRLAIEALRLKDRTVQQIMQPRIDIDAADVNTPPQEVLGVLAMAGFSRLPVYENDLDHILGYVHMKDALRQHYLGWSFDLRKLLRPALFVPATMRVGQLLFAFQKGRNQLAIVVDEFGGTKGMVTLEHVLEELVGEIARDSHRQEDRRIVQHSATSWLVEGSVPIADWLKILTREHLARETPRHVHTIAGLILAEIGRIPSVGESVVWHDLRLEVVEVEGQRIQRVLVTIVGPDAGNRGETEEQKRCR